MLRYKRSGGDPYEVEDGTKKRWLRVLWLHGSAGFSIELSHSMNYRFVFLRKTYLEGQALHTLPCLCASGLLDQWSVTSYRSVRVRRREGGGKAAAAICWLINVLHHLTFGFMKRFFVYIYIYPQLGSVCRSRFSDVRINCRTQATLYWMYSFERRQHYRPVLSSTYLYIKSILIGHHFFCDIYFGSWLNSWFCDTRIPLAPVFDSLIFIAIYLSN